MTATKKKQRLGETLAKQVIKPEAKAYIPSPAALNILEKIFENKKGDPPLARSQGMTYTELKRSIGKISDTYISKTLNQLQEHDAVDHVEGLYHITQTGVSLLGVYRGFHFPLGQEADLGLHTYEYKESLFREIRRLHKKFYASLFYNRSLHAGYGKEPRRPFSVTIFEYTSKNSGKPVIGFVYQDLSDDEITRLSTMYKSAIKP